MRAYRGFCYVMHCLGYADFWLVIFFIAPFFYIPCMSKLTFDDSLIKIVSVGGYTPMLVF